MCGIVGYTGPREAYPIIIKGLKRLEYRGYDSAGIATLDHGALARRRVRSRMANRAHHNFRFTMETVPEGEAAGVQRFMDNFDISKPIEERIDPDFVTDYLVERFTIAGTPQECIAKVKKLEADGIQRILLTPPNAIYDQVMDAWGTRVIQKY